MILFSAGIIFLISLILAIRSAKGQFSVPNEVNALKVPKRTIRSTGGVILFFREKVTHYTSVADSSSEDL